MEYIRDYGWPVLKIVVFTVLARGVLLVLANANIHPEEWVSSVIGNAISSGAAGWLIAGIVGVAGMVTWEFNNRNRAALSAADSAPVKRISRQLKFPLWEAACLLAGVPAQKDPRGEAASYLHQLKSIALNERWQDPLAKQGKRLKLPPEFAADAIDNISENTEIGRATLKAFAISNGVSVKGLTE